MSKTPISQLTNMARELRVQIIKMIYKAKSGHLGGSLSAIDMLTALYFYKMRYDPKLPTWEDRDRFVLSSGHTCPALYAILAQLGVFSADLLATLRQLGSPLQGHPKFNLGLGIEMSTGSLGQGCSVANGMALAARVKNQNWRVYSLETDGGSQEGMMWEAVMAAAHYKLDNRCVLFDYNNIQIDGFVSDVMDVAPLPEKFRAFGWHVIEIDGHDMPAICGALDKAEQTKGRPTAIIGKTVLGKGVSLFENKPKYHGTPPTDEEYKTAMQELGGNL